jgi:hypothetical protein
MSNGGACCILRICCPPDKAEAALAGEIRTWGFSKTKAAKLAAMIFAKWDLAPLGTAQAVKDGWGAGAELRAAAIGDRMVALYAGVIGENAPAATEGDGHAPAG